MRYRPGHAGSSPSLRTSSSRPVIDKPFLQADEEDVEDLGLLKLDVLGVRMQAAMAHAVAEIRRRVALWPCYGGVGAGEVGECPYEFRGWGSACDGPSLRVQG